MIYNLEKNIHCVNFLESAEACNKYFSQLKIFISDCMGRENASKMITSATLGKALKNMKNFTNSVYFRSLVVIYDNQIIKNLKIN